MLVPFSALSSLELALLAVFTAASAALFYPANVVFSADPFSNYHILQASLQLALLRLFFCTCLLGFASLACGLRTGFTFPTYGWDSITITRDIFHGSALYGARFDAERISVFSYARSSSSYSMCKLQLGFKKKV